MERRATGFPGAILDLITSARTVTVLFALLVCLLVPSTLSAKLAPLFLAPVRIILLLFGLSLAVCTLRRLKSLRASTLVIHLGTIAILAGGGLSSLGWVATVNIYEGSSTATVYNWDLEKEVGLGVDLQVAKIHTEYYPVPVRIGIVRNGRQAELITSRTGEDFAVDGYRVRVLALDPGARTLTLAVKSQEDRPLGTIVTGGSRDLPPGFPLDFALVAFQDPVVRRLWVDLALRQENRVVAAGATEVNQPLQWGGMRFFLTQVEVDRLGRPYAGIQISRDPGLPVVYAGFVILGLGLILALKRWALGSAKYRA